MKMKLLISDLDGTIVETEDYHRLAYNALFKELGLNQYWEKQDYKDRLETMGGNKIREVFKWMKLPEAKFNETKKRLYHRKTELYTKLITHDLRKGDLRLRPGISDFFDQVIQAGIPIAIATACVGWAAEKVLEAALGKKFAESLLCLCGGESTAKHKPAPDVYLLVAKKTAIPPSSCLVLEDTSHGVRAAKAAGMVCVATPSEFALEHNFSMADLVLENLEKPIPLSLSKIDDLFRI